MENCGPQPCIQTNLELTLVLKLVEKKLLNYNAITMPQPIQGAITGHFPPKLRNHRAVGIEIQH